MVLNIKDFMEKIQKELWEGIYDEYKNHYFDYWSEKFKQKFIFDKIFSKYNFSQKSVCELCCGSGENSKKILQKYNDIELVGFDLSIKAVNDFKSLLGKIAYEQDIQSPITNFDNSFDVIFVLGGIHHCTKNLNGVFENISRMLRPDGVFIMHEPNSKFFLEPIRKIWYKSDGLFDHESEHALNHEELIKFAGIYGFEQTSLEYTGGPGFFFILQSMILRVPKKIKNLLSPFFFLLESIWDKQNSPYLNNTFISIWTKRKT